MINFCVSGLMSKCTAGNTWADQRKCKFSERSSVAKRCMFFIEAIDGHCDCEAAQNHARNPDSIREEEELLIEDLITDELSIEQRIRNCSVCENLCTQLTPRCHTPKYEPDAEMYETARLCLSFNITASCVICKNHDQCHAGDGDRHYGLNDKINVAQTCKQYHPITNNVAGDDDDIPF